MTTQPLRWQLFTSCIFNTKQSAGMLLYKKIKQSNQYPCKTLHFKASSEEPKKVHPFWVPEKQGREGKIVLLLQEAETTLGLETFLTRKKLLILQCMAMYKSCLHWSITYAVNWYPMPLLTTIPHSFETHRSAYAYNLFPPNLLCA